MRSSLICLVDGAGDLAGGGDCWDCGAGRGRMSNHFFPFLRYWAAFKIPKHFACTHP